MTEVKDPAYPPTGQPYPTQATAPYPQQQGSPQSYPTPPGYPAQQQGYPSQAGYAQQGYSPAQAGYPQAQQGYTTQTYVPQAVYTPQGQVTIKTGAPSGHTVMVRETQCQPNDYLCFSIFVMLFCCLPFGIIALIKSMDVRSLFAVQNYAGAARASQSAKNWNVAGLVTGLIIEVLTLIILIVWFVVFANAAAKIVDNYTFTFGSDDYYP